MSVQTIIATLTELIEIHEKLIKISKQKTEIIKEGSIEKLQPILSSERKCVQELEKIELKRQEKIEAWCHEHALDDKHITITEILDHLSNQPEAEQLEETTIYLTNLITRLKQQEQLNHELIIQSMQFIQLSLDMMSPTIKHLNYGKNKALDTVKRSVFDSKA